MQRPPDVTLKRFQRDTNHRLRQFMFISFPRSVWPVVTAMLLISACDGGSALIKNQRDDDSSGSLDDPDAHQQGAVSYSTVADNIWPPQPVGVSNVKPYRDNNTVAPVRDVKRDDSIMTAVLSDELLAMTGSRYEVISSALHQVKAAKGGAQSYREIEIYSYSHDRLITVAIDSNGHTTSHWQAASEYQPAETADEVNRAIKLAASHLLESGVDTSGLTGTGLLAHPTRAEYESTGLLFYSQRILYVTFGHGEGSTPLFRADVNLSTETVSNAGAL